MTVRCDECGNVFECVAPKTRELANGILQAFIKCPSCNTETGCFYSNDRVRELQDQQRTIQFEIKRIYRSKQSNPIKQRKIDRLTDEFEDNKAKIRWEMQMIENKMA